MHSDFDTLHDVPPEALAEFLAIPSGTAADWDDDEAGEALQFVLAMPLPATSPESAHEPMTVRDLLLAPHPDAVSLSLLKRFARVHGEHPDVLLPGDVARGLYFLSIGAARVRCAGRISSLDDGAVRDGLAWVLDQPWLTDDLRPTAMDLLAAIDSGGKP